MQDLQRDEKDVEGPPAGAVRAFIAGLVPHAGQDVARVQIQARVVKGSHEEGEKDVRGLEAMKKESAKR